MTARSEREREGILLHAKHALAPNGLGYCGPDENRKMLESLRRSSASEDLVSVLTRFEAAYPFIRMIGESTGRSPFDYSVTEAYWIGNSLLDRVEPSKFFEFVHQGLKVRMGRGDAKALFREAGVVPRPHHSFYVMSLFSRSSDSPSSASKLTELMDSCRISWGRVTELKGKELIVESRPLTVEDGRLRLSDPVRKAVRYDSELPGFSSVRKGDWVSIHWNSASERLTRRQVRNIEAYTLGDIEAANRYAELAARRGRKG